MPTRVVNRTDAPVTMREAPLLAVAVAVAVAAELVPFRDIEGALVDELAVAVAEATSVEAVGAGVPLVEAGFVVCDWVGSILEQ